jgi:hypothetical protein
MEVEGVPITLAMRAKMKSHERKGKPGQIS